MVSSLNTEDNLREIAKKMEWEIPETQKMLELAASQRMNTDTRRAILCILMSGEDYMDTFEKLTRLNLSGKQDREIMRVLVECCLQEKVFNKYFCVLASKLCRHDKNHKFSLQYCLWGHLKEIESMQLLRSLSKFTAEMLASFTLSLAALKVVDLCDPELSPKRIKHFKMLFEAVFEYPDKARLEHFHFYSFTARVRSSQNWVSVLHHQIRLYWSKRIRPEIEACKESP